MATFASSSSFLLDFEVLSNPPSSIFHPFQMVDSTPLEVVPFLLLRSHTWERLGQVDKAVQYVERALEEEKSLQVSQMFILP